MTIYYLDASAWVKRFGREAGSNWMADLFAQRDPFACATLGFIEVVATLARKRKARLVDDARLDEALLEVERDWTVFIKVALDSETQAVAIDIARRHALRGGDTVHLASAILLRGLSSPEGVAMVTSDGEMKAAALAEGFTVLDPAVEEQRASGNSSRQ